MIVIKFYILLIRKDLIIKLLNVKNNFHLLVYKLLGLRHISNEYLQIEIKRIKEMSNILSFGGRIIGVIGTCLGCPNFFYKQYPNNHQ